MGRQKSNKLKPEKEDSVQITGMQPPVKAQDNVSQSTVLEIRYPTPPPCGCYETEHSFVLAPVCLIFAFSKIKPHASRSVDWTKRSYSIWYRIPPWGDFDFRTLRILLPYLQLGVTLVRPRYRPSICICHNVYGQTTIVSERIRFSALS